MSQRRVRIRRAENIHVDIVIEVAEPPPDFVWQTRARMAKLARTEGRFETFLDVHVFTADKQLSVGKPVGVTLPSGTKLADPLRQATLDQEFGNTLKRRCWTVPDLSESSDEPVIVLPMHPTGDDSPCTVQICLTFRFVGPTGPSYEPLERDHVPSGWTFLAG